MGFREMLASYGYENEESEVDDEDDEDEEQKDNQL